MVKMFKRYLYNSYRRFSALTHRFSGRVTKTGWLLLSALVISAALGLNTDLSVAYQTFTFLFCVIFVAWFGLSFNRARFSVERILPRLGCVGDPLRYRATIVNQSRSAQRGLFLRDQTQDPRPSFDEFRLTPEPDEEKRNLYDRTFGYYRWQWLISKNEQGMAHEHAVSAIPPRGKLELEMTIVPLKRGYLRFTEMVVATPEPLGLFRSLRKVPAPQSVLILPKRYQITALDLPGITKYQQGGVAMAGSIGESEEFVSLRDYRAGDAMRHIHWKSFAKMGKPIVKEFHDEFFVRHALILDTFDIHRHSDRFEEAVSIAASFAYTIHTQESLLDLMFVGPQAYCFTSGRGVAHMEQMLEILAAVQPCEDKPFEILEELVLQHINTVSGCICIFTSWDQRRQDFVEQLKIMQIPCLVLVVTDSPTTLPPGPMADDPKNFRALPVGKVGEELAKL